MEHIPKPVKPVLYIFFGNGAWVPAHMIVGSHTDGHNVWQSPYAPCVMGTFEFG